MIKNRWIITSFISLFIGLGVINTVLAAGSLKQNFKQVDIGTVIEAVAKVSGHNFIIDPRVKGKVTFIAPEGMEPEGLYQSLLAILSVHGYAAIPGDDVIKIVPANMARDQIPYRSKKVTSEDWVTEVVNIEHVEATKLVAVLRPLVAKEGHLVALADSNKLIISDTISNINRIKEILKRVDVDSSTLYEVISVEHSSAEELAKTLKGLIGATKGGNNVKVSFDARSNRLILSGDEQKRLMLRTLIADLDVKVASEGRVQVIYLRYAKAAEIAPILRKIAGNRSLINSVSNDSSAKAKNQNTSSGPISNKKLKEQISIESDERMNALVISAPTPIVTALKGVIKQLDIRRAQVLIEAIFVEISEDKAANLGIEWGALGQAGAGMVSFSGALTGLMANSGDVAAQSQFIGRGITIGGGDINAKGEGWGALIKALNTDTSSNILATPSILTLDNEEAEIVVGREVPFQTGSYTSTADSASNPFSTIERKPVGLKLKVKPQINEGNEIYLDIDQEVSDVLPKGEAVDIQTTKRQIKTRVIVGDGNMVVLGGLIDEKEILVESKVPFLGDIPILGALFRSTENSREKVNLMVFLRPVIIRDNVMSDYYSQKKYSYIYQEQAALIDNHDASLLDGLRSRLPALETWQSKEPMTSKPVKPELVVKKKESTSNDQNTLETPESPEVSAVDELLDL